MTRPLDRRRFLALGGAASLALLDACSGGSSTPAVPNRFSDDFHRPPGPLGNGWTDAHSAVPRYEDRVGIVDGGVADVALQGSRDQDPSSSGWRGAFYREFPSGTGVRVATTVYLRHGQSTSGGGPLVHAAPTTTAWGLGAWYDVGLGLDWYEFGLIGKQPADFRYLDTFSAPRPTEDGTFQLEIRSVGEMATVFADGRRVCGPVALPAELASSSLHGGQIDIGSRAEQSVAQIEDITIESFAGEPPAAYGPAVLRTGDAVSVSGESIRLPLPAGAVAGDLLVAVVAVAAGGELVAPAGWLEDGGSRVILGPRLACYSRTFDARTGPPTIGLGGPANATGVVVRASGANPHVGLAPGYASNRPSRAAVGRPQRIFGPHRAGLWAAVAPRAAVIAAPAGWRILADSRTDTGVTLCVAARADWGDGPDRVVAPYGLRGTLTSTPSGHLAQEAPSVTMTSTVQPFPSPLG